MPQITVRVRTPDEMLRLAVDLGGQDQTVQHLMNKIQGFPGGFSLANNPQNKRPFPPSTQLANIPLQHGDMLFLIPSVDSTKAQDTTLGHTAEVVNNVKNEDADVVVDEVDRMLEKHNGLINRGKDSNFCRHGANAMCDYCMPLEPYDQGYLDKQKIKHLSLHSYIRKLIGSGKPQPAKIGNLAALEEPSYTVNRDCDAGHAPYPQSMCAKCQPSAVILHQQQFRMVDHVEFDNPKMVDNFISFWRETGLQRFGYLIGKYVPYAEVPLGIKAVVHAIYEPPQKPASDGVELERDPHEKSIEHIASELGLSVVGMIYTDLTDDGSKTGKVEYRRHPDAFFVSSAEIAFIAQHQQRHPNFTRLNRSHRFGSKFVTVIISGDKENQIHVSAYQVSNSGMAMIRDEICDASFSATQMRVRESTREQYIPEVFYRYKNEYGANVQAKADPSFPVEYLLVTLSEGFPQKIDSMFKSTEFPIENRGGLGLQDMQTVKKVLVDGSQKIRPEALSDFHLLTFLKFSGVFTDEDFKQLVNLIVSGSINIEKCLSENTSWQTLLMILKELSSKSTAPSSAAESQRTLDQQQKSWTCVHCTFSNTGTRRDCEMCGLPRNG